MYTVAEPAGVSTYLSFEVIFETLKRTSVHVKEQITTAPYRLVTARLERACELYGAWIEIYKLFAEGYRKEIMTWSKPYAILSLSMADNALEERLIDVFQAKIPAEVYILLDSILGELGRSNEFYVVAEGDCFEQRSIYEEMYSHSLKHLHVPRPTKESKRLDQLFRFILQKDSAILYYERGQYDNALSWPLLIHETLHCIYMSEGLDSLEEKVSDRPTWINEVLIDMYITNLLGPAYATSLASYLYRYPHEETLSHPHFIVRLYACSKYLTDLTKVSNLPPPIDKEIYEALEYIEQVQRRHEDVLKEVQSEVNQIYDRTRDEIVRKISRKAKPFTSFIQDLERERERVSHVSPKTYPEKQVFSINDVQLYYKRGIPVAAHPKVLFNSFISKQYLNEGVDALFVKESLKKWHVRRTWEKIQL